VRSHFVSGTAGAASIPGTNLLCPLMPALYALQSGLNPEGSEYTELIFTSLITFNYL
jgi:hypothetical protein